MARKFYIEHPSKNRIRELDAQGEEFIAFVDVSITHGADSMLLSNTDLSTIAAELLKNWLEANVTFSQSRSR